MLNSALSKQDNLIEKWIKPVTDDARLIQAFRTIPRALFVPAQHRSEAYQDHAIALDHNQSISQPSLVALMIDLCQLKPEHIVLEIGTGSGYQTALLAKIVKKVYSVEIIPELAAAARDKLTRLGITNTEIITSNGRQGYSAAAPYDAIIVTASGSQVPAELVSQLKSKGIIVIPLKDEFGREYLYRGINKNGLHLQMIVPVRFVPLVNSRIDRE